MTDTINEWAARHGVSAVALADLRRALTVQGKPPYKLHATTPEGKAQASVRLAAANAGWLLWRNNVGATYTDTGAVLRYGLANETKAMNQQIKSADLIGLRPVQIDATHLGRTMGQFVAIECKREGWAPGARSGREAAQSRFLALVESCGGYGRFSTGGITG